MNKLLLALLTGMLITFIADFFLFLGLKLNYFDFYEIEIYYNVLFADNQNFILYFFLSIIFGSVVIFIANNKLTLMMLSMVTLLAIAPLFSSVGKKLGSYMFMKKDKTYRDAKHTFVGDVYYDGRTTIHFYDKELNKMILLQKNKLFI